MLITSLVISFAAIVVVWAVAMVFAFADGRVGRRARLSSGQTALQLSTVVQGSSPAFSIVIPAREQLDALKRHLPAILEQDYDCYEVIVVDMASTDGTKDFLEQMELQYHNLRHTAVPASARDISLDRLALTLGIRSARYDWVVMTRANCEPLSSAWLTCMADAISQQPEADVVLGSAQYVPQMPKWLYYKEDFFRLWHTLGTANHVLSGHAAVRADSCNVAIRRTAFLSCGGFSVGQTLQVGAVELLVNTLSTKTNTALALHPDSAIAEERPYNARFWRQSRLFYAAIRREQSHVKLYRLVQALRIIQPWAALLCIAIPLIACIFVLSRCVSLDWNYDMIAQYISPALVSSLSELDAAYDTSWSLYLLIAALACLVLMMFSYYATRIVCFNRSARALGQHCFYSSLLLFDLLLPFWQIATAVRHIFTPSSTFRKRFI